MLRPFDPTRDREAARRIWRETGWLEHGQEKQDTVDRWVDAGRALVAEIEGEAECLVLTAPGRLAYLSEQLPASLVTGVTTSRIARKQGHAMRLTARAVAEDVAEGAIVAALGMFDQGFYNRIGFGSGSYETYVGFDPGHLTVRESHRVPVRLKASDWELVHAARLARPQRHGQCSVLPGVGTRGPMEESADQFGLGYRDPDSGELTHHFWGKPKGEHGPYRIEWMVYHTRAQFLELMALLKSMGDQVRMVRMYEPPGIQLQDLMYRPFKQIQISAKSDFAASITARAFFQYRICDLPACLSHTHLNGPEARFNLVLSDPISNFLEAGTPWMGAAGEYVVTLGSESCAECGVDASLPTLTATVGAFTRLWLGVRPATGLALTDDIAGPQELLERLDEVLRLPLPRNDWDY